MSVRPRWNWNLEVLVFKERGVPGEKPLGATESNNNKLNPHMASSTSGFDPGSRSWEASAVTTAPPLPPVKAETLVFTFECIFLISATQPFLVSSRNAPLVGRNVA